MRFVILLTLFVLLGLPGRAAHIVGGEIYYDYLGNNNYRFYLSIYIECGSAAGYDDPLFLSIYAQGGSIPVQQHSIPAPPSTILPITFNNPCVIPPSGLCIEKAVYVKVVTLPPAVGGYTITYQRCCRSDDINNLVNPGNTGFSLSTRVPGVTDANYINSSPRYTNYPPLLLCSNEDLIFNHAASDPDGDQLVYSLVTPYDGGGTQAFPSDCFNCVQPNPAAPPPYFPVQWAGGFNATTPLGPGSTITINPTTGLLTASPNMQGLFVVGIRVQEYRNGVLLSETVRDFLFKVFYCNVTMSAILPTQEQLSTFESYCQGLTVQFENNSFGGTSYSWNFGVPGITTDFSTQFEPTYTYPAPGIYNAMLVVNPGSPCTDTAYMEVNVNNEFNVSFTTLDSICVIDNSLDFFAQSDGPPSTTYEWNFGPSASIENATGVNVMNINFDTSGFIPITIDASYEYCDATYTDSIYLFPEPTAEIELPDNPECAGLSIQFGNNSQESTAYSWDFGIAGTTSDVSNDYEPVYTFPGPGSYTITLISGSTSTCFDTTTQTITLNEPLLASFTHDDSLCVTNNSFDFDGTVTGPPGFTFQWNFGPNANPQTSSDMDVSGVQFNTFGTFPITLTAYTDICTEVATSSIFIFREPEIDFRVEPGPRCAPALVQFTDLSVYDAPLLYSWTFGDGNTSTEQNPSNLYQNAGQYNISLEIMSTIGCIDTLYLMKQDYVTIFPVPVSSFTVSPIETDICHAEITFTDQSVGADNIYYWFDDSTYYAEGANLVHNYTTSGTHYPMQIASNEAGCSDTSYAELYIEPFSIYIPNTFTPDGNEFNNDFSAKFALDVIEWEFKIYDRWGELVYHSLDPKDAWDGVYLNYFGLVQEGTYSYVLRYVSCELPDSWQILTGHVNVLR